MAEEHELPSFIRHNGNGNGKGIIASTLRKVRGLPTWQKGALVVAAALAVDHAIAPRGMSFASKALGKVGGRRSLPPPPPPIPPPGVTAAVAKGMFAGANAQAGWNRGMSPYGGWARNAPGGPWHYAHAAPGSAWEEAMNNGYPWE